MTTLPTLYKRSTTGADQFWTIATEASTIVTRWGQLDGAVQETRDNIATGKNLGKKNETTREQQAELEAHAQWEKKLKKGYVQSLEDARDGKVDADAITGGIAPMLAHKFSEQGHKLTYPCYVQPKLDGHRCIAIVHATGPYAGKCTLWTRTRKPIASMVHIQRAIEALGLEPGTVLDGELYNHDYRDKFEELTSFIRDTKAKPGAEVVQYHIYDVITDEPFEARCAWLSGELEDVCDSLRLVPTRQAADEDELMLAFDHFRGLGFEGAMARNAAGKYVNKRSYDLLKIKEFTDSEFVVAGVEEGRGKLAGHAIFVCATAEDEPSEFRVKMVGETAALKQYFDRPELAIGRMLTVKYQGLTTKNGVPRFPVALRFREDA